MSGEDRQRILREAGHAPAEAEKQEGAKSSREQAAREEARSESGQPRSPDEPRPLVQDDDDKPRPRAG
jgi:hypothetical protein